VPTNSGDDSNGEKSEVTGSGGKVKHFSFISISCSS
jgi:hypothetical protein